MGKVGDGVLVNAVVVDLWRKERGFLLHGAARAKVKAIDAGAQVGTILLDAIDGEHTDARASRFANDAGQMTDITTRLELC